MLPGTLNQVPLPFKTLVCWVHTGKIKKHRVQRRGLYLGWVAGLPTVSGGCRSPFQGQYSLCSQKRRKGLGAWFGAKRSSSKEPEVVAVLRLGRSRLPSPLEISGARLSTHSRSEPTARSITAARSVLELPGMSTKCPVFGRPGSPRRRNWLTKAR